VRERVTVVEQVPAARPTLQSARALLGGRIAVPGVHFPAKS